MNEYTTIIIIAKWLFLCDHASENNNYDRQ